MKLFTHYCIGDHLICYGFVKEFSKIYDEIYLTTKNSPKHIETIERLYSTIPNVHITPDHFDEYNIMISSGWWFEQVKHWYQYPMPDTPFPFGEDMIFDRFWYKLAGVDFNKKWDNFYLERNLDKEKEIYYDVLGLKDDERYVFLHEDRLNTDEDRSIKRYLFNTDMRVISITNYPDINILDTSFLIENSEEVHVINSSFRTFIDLMNIKHNNLNYHMYARANPAEQVAVRLKWNIYNK